MEIDFDVTRVFNENVKAYKNNKIRLIINRGGSSSSKTISILQFLTLYALKYKEKTITIVGATVPFLKKATINDWKKIVMGEMWDSKCFNKTELTYTFPNNSKIQFISGDAGETRIRGIRSDIAYFDEVNNIQESVYEAVSIRTREKVFVSFNPVAEFYIVEEAEREDAIEIISTYIDNPFLEIAVIKELELRAARDENFRRVFVLGEYGNLLGVIFLEGTEWKIIDDLPTEFDSELWGADWGFTNDPTTLTQARFIGKSVYIKEHMYETNLINSLIAKKFLRSNINNEKIIADSAEPKTIADLKRTYGINIVGVKKLGVLESINNLKEYKIFITKDSLNAIKEFRYYQWSQTKKDKKGRVIPNDNWNHIIDAIRYIVDTMFKPKSKNPVKMIKW